MKKLILLLTIILALGLNSIMAQNDNCLGWNNPSNFTFTGGYGLTAWSGKVGTKPSTASNCISGTVGLSLTTPVANSSLATVTDNGSSTYCGSSLNTSNEFRIMSSSEGNDPLVGSNPALPMVPTGFQKSIRIGNCQIDAHAEALYYTMTVKPNNALLFINYAIVIQSPGHGVSSDPEFIIRVCHQVGNNWVPVSDTLCYVVSSTPATNGGSVTIGQNGWHSNGSGYSAVYYKDWTQVAVSLFQYLYQEVRIEIMIGDCSASGHYGYCYVAGNCQPMNLTANGCASGSSAQVAAIKAPKGLHSYQWYRSRTGVLSGTGRTNAGNYSTIQGATTDSLQVEMPHFINQTNASDTLTQNTFKCVMTSFLDPTKPVTSTLYTDVGNMKPTLSVDSTLNCNGSITLSDRSVARFTNNIDSNEVDTTATVWKFYNTTTPGLVPVATVTGGSASHLYETAGDHCVVVRTASHKVDGSGNRTCWNEKTVRIRSIKGATPAIELGRDNLCVGDTIAVYNRTPGAIYHHWHFYNEFGLDTSFTTPTPAVQFSFTRTTIVELTTYDRTTHLEDTNMDGHLEYVPCPVVVRDTIHVGSFPVLQVTGDTIVCNGTQSIVNVSSDVQGCTYDWYTVQGGTPIQTNSTTLTTTPTNDITYYVKVTSPNGCVSWDSIDITMVKPTLNFRTKYGTPQICTGDTAILWAGKAASYAWTASPDNDATFWGQEGHDTIRVSPSENTTYSVVGKGTNGCEASALSQKITVFPYPIMAIQLTPGYIDSENPSVQFSDLSEYGTSSLWNFGNGNTSTTRSVVHTFTDLSQDSILISLITGNALGCTNDTSFYVPIGIFSVWFPNAFTPRLESNNLFLPYTSNVLVDYELTIYDRSGSMVFHTADINEGWDGTYKGKECSQGAYVYITTYRRPGVERLMSQKGTVTLLR